MNGGELVENGFWLIHEDDWIKIMKRGQITQYVSANRTNESSLQLNQSNQWSNGIEAETENVCQTDIR